MARTKMYRTNLISSFLCQAVIQMLLLLAGDVEQNPGPPKILKQASHLGIHHLKDIHEELIHVSHKWYDIGLQLNLPVGTLQKIREQYADPQTCLCEMLNRWLVTVNPYPTWRTLVKVLKRRAVGEHSLADELKAKHCKGKGKERTRAISLPKARTKVELVKVKREPSDDSADNDTEGLLPDEVTSQPLGSESLNPSERVTWGHDTGSSSTATHEHHRTPVFGCGCKRCTIANFSDGCPKPITPKTGLPYLDASGLTEHQEKILRGRLLHESEEMVFDFRDLLSTVRKSLIQQNILPKDLVAELLSLGVLNPVHSKAKAQGTHTPTFRECQKELREAIDIDSVFFIIEDYYSFFNYKIIKGIIKVFGTNDDREALRLYEEKFERYCKRRVFECPPHIYGSRSESDHASLVVKKDNLLDNFSIHQLDVFHYKLCEILQITVPTMQLLSVEEGCLQLTFQIPSFVQHLIFPLSEDQEASLRAEGVLVLMCGDYKFQAQEHAENDDATNTSPGIPHNVLNDVAAILDGVQNEPTAVCNQDTSPPIAEMEVFNLASLGLNDGPGLPLQHLGLEHELLGDCHKRKLEEQQWEEELILGLKRSRLQEGSTGVPEDLKPPDMKQELPVGTFGSILGESVKSEASRAEDGQVEEESIKPKVEGDPWMESKPKTEADHEFGIKTERWMKTEDLVKKEMKMEWIPPTDKKFICQQMKIESKDLMEEKVDLWDSVTKLEALDLGLCRVISANILRLQAQNNVLEEELACKEKELARKDDLIATNYKQIAELQQQIHALQPTDEMPKEQLDIPTTVPAVGTSVTSSDSEEQLLIQELLEEFTEGPSGSQDMDMEASSQLEIEIQPEDVSCSTSNAVRPGGYFDQFNQPSNTALHLPPTSMPADLARSRISYPVPISNFTSYPTPTQQWYQDVNPDLRQHLVRQLVEAIYPVQDPMGLQDKRVASLIQYAMKVEKAMLETATSRWEYFQLLAEKIYRIRKELEERRRAKNEMEKISRMRQGGMLPDQAMVNGEPILQPSYQPRFYQPCFYLPQQQLGVPQPPQNSTKIHSLRKVFTVDELEKALRPIFDAVWKQDPESNPFRQPIDRWAFGIPDYFNIIKEPMDLSTISRRLKAGEYKTPWEFCRDMWLMFDNAWLYYKKTSYVYKYCTKLTEVFDSVIDNAMCMLGYCCGKKYTFYPQVLYCYGKPLCTIPRDTAYYGYQNSQYVYCPKCFSEIPGDTITVGDDHMTATVVHKSAFREMKNDTIDYEPMVECIHCGREMHKICVLHHENIWAKGFQCDSCLKAKGTVRKENKFSAKRLPTTKLATYLEDRINNFLRTMKADTGVVTVRIVSSSDKTLDTRTLMRNRFQGDFPEQFPYRTKAMFVFEEIDGVDVCFFGMHVQEYGSDCQAPNTRRVYISYLDSVHFFRPRHLRTQVYHEILIGYLEFCKNNGYLTAHIWARPPCEDDYIFHCHPVEQKFPKPKRLIDWFRKMLDIGKSEGVVWDYWDIFKYCTEDGRTSVTATEIPYFSGDIWPNIIEESIKELDPEAMERETSEQASGEGHWSKKAGGYKSKLGGDNLSQRLYHTMQKYKEVFFVVLLQPPLIDTSSPLPSTTDPDQLINCYLMDGRDTFLAMCREQHWEFSSLRRAKFSSMAMLYEIQKYSANIQKGLQFLVHASNCRDPMCKQPSCIKMKRVLRNTRDCKLRMSGNCTICKQFLQLCYSHAKVCIDEKCPVPTCARIKKNLREQRAQQQMRQDRFTQRRMINMSQMISNSSGSHNHQVLSTVSPAPAHTLPDNLSTANNPSTSTNTVPTSMVAPSPVGRRSIGEGDPIIPGDTHTPGQQSILMGSSSPPSLLHAVPQPSSPLEQSMLVPNIAVSTGGGPPEQSDTPRQQVTMEQQILSALRGPYQIQKQRAMIYLQQHPELTPRVQALAHEQSEAIPQELLPQVGSTLTYQQAFTGIPQMNPMATVGEYMTPSFPSAAGHAEAAHSTILQSPEHWLSPVIDTHDDTFPTVPSAVLPSSDDPKTTARLPPRDASGPQYADRS